MNQAKMKIFVKTRERIRLVFSNKKGPALYLQNHKNNLKKERRF